MNGFKTSQITSPYDKESIQSRKFDTTFYLQFYPISQNPALPRYLINCIPKLPSSHDIIIAIFFNNYKMSDNDQQDDDDNQGFQVNRGTVQIQNDFTNALTNLINFPLFDGSQNTTQTKPVPPTQTKPVPAPSNSLPSNSSNQAQPSQSQPPPKQLPAQPTNPPPTQSQAPASNLNPQKNPPKESKKDLLTKYFRVNAANSVSIHKSSQPKQADGYSPGDFSKFAMEVEEQMNAKNSFIQKTIKQAVISYQLKLKQNYEKLRDLLGINKMNDQSPFTTQEQVKQYMKDPIQYYMKRYASINVMNFVAVHVKKKKYLYKSAMVDGKLVQAAKLKLSDRFYHNGNLYLSTQVKNLYIKLSSTQKPVKVIFKQGKFLQQKDFIVDSQNVKQEIFGMVLLYLKKMNYLLEEDEIQKVKIGITSQIKTP